MASDLSRKTFKREKHYSGVLMQQGRVQLDADWNEQLDLRQYRTHTESKDVIGQCGVPRKSGAFKITVAPDGSGLEIAAGHMYVGGLLCELDNPATYFDQPYYPNPDDNYFSFPVDSPLSSPPPSPPAARLENGVYIVYIDAWQREVNYLDDPLIQEVALGEADTATRLQTAWQVKLLKTDASHQCETEVEAWKAPTGKLNARAKKDEETEDPCLLPPQAGYRRLENQLYRVEVQKGGDLANTTFKWSRDNASVETKVLKAEGSVLTVADIGRDEILGFAGGQWVEIVDEISSLQGNPQQLIQIDSVDPALREITLNTFVIPNRHNGELKLRRWDQSGPAAGPDGLAAGGGGWISLEDGVQVHFSEGNYRPGDYWLIPARTATGEVEWPPYEIPNLAPLAQPPAGVKHYYCKLAIARVHEGGINVQDCRPLFPSLTEISTQDDLRDHNKHLHGYGVVCGLKVKCGPGRQSVVVENGYALDCEGNVVRIRNQGGMLYNVLAEAGANGLLDDKGNGNVCLTIANNGNGEARIMVENYVHKDFWEEILEGSLLKDFFEGCIGNLIDFFRNQFSVSLDDTPPVPIGQRRLTAFINLLAQLINSESGRYGFISGVRDIGRENQECGEGSDEERYEDKLLWCFYNQLRRQLASETYCAMFDRARPFPDYDLDPGLETIFGPAIRGHHKLRLHPSNNYAYTSGFDNKIYAYNLESRAFAYRVVFPASPNIRIQDIAISSDGRQLYAVGVLEERDSVFAVADIDASGNLAWRPSSVECGIKYVSLAAGPSGRLYSVGKGRGLFEISGIGTDAYLADHLYPYNATGLLLLADDGSRIFVAAGENNGVETDDFTQIFNHNLASSSPTRTYRFAGNDFGNDLLFHRGNNTLYATGTDASGQRVLGFVNAEDGDQFSAIPLEDSEYIRLELSMARETGEFLMLTLSDKLKVVRVYIPNHDLDREFRIPAQVFPLDIAFDNKAGRGYILNAPVNTLTEIDLARAYHTDPAPNFTHEPPYELAEYRYEVMAAYQSLFRHFIQYLKDCFCEKFLIDCPDCGPDDKVYLGCVEIRDGEVFNICNFTRRKYVKTFRTVEYWLSAFPVLPVFKKAFAQFCCLILDPKTGRDDFFTNKNL